MKTSLVVDDYCRIRGCRNSLFTTRVAFERFQDEFSGCDPVMEFEKLSYLLDLVIKDCGGEDSVDTLSETQMVREFEHRLDKVRAEDSYDVLVLYRYLPEALKVALEKNMALGELCRLKYVRYLSDDEFVKKEANRLYSEMEALGNKMNEDVPYLDITYALEVYDGIMSECKKDVKFIMGEDGQLSLRMIDFLDYIFASTRDEPEMNDNQVWPEDEDEDAGDMDDMEGVDGMEGEYIPDKYDGFDEVSSVPEADIPDDYDKMDEIFPTPEDIPDDYDGIDDTFSVPEDVPDEKYDELDNLFRSTKNKIRTEERGKFR